MSNFLKGQNRITILLLCINIGVILSQEDKCTTIEHCKKCPEQNKCEICEDGFKLNEENKCIETTKDNNQDGQNNPAPQQTPSAGSQPAQQAPTGSQPAQQAPTGSQPAQQTPPAGSQPAQQAPAQNSPNASAQKASNNPVPSNLGNNMNNDLQSNGRGILRKFIIYSIVGVTIFICLRWLFSKKKSKTGYFYDESGNPAEKAKVVYIQ